MVTGSTPTGSFGIPKEMQEEIAKSKRKARGDKPLPEPEVAYDSESIPETEGPQQDPDAETDNPKKEEQFGGEDLSKVISNIKEDLAIEISEDDVWDFILNGTLTKQEVCIIPGRLHATFKSLTLDQSHDVNRKMAVLLKEEILEDGYKGLQTQHLLALGLLALGKPGHLKSLGETVEDRFKAVGGMSTFLIRKIGDKWNSFSVLLANSLEGNEDVKKP